MPTLTINPSSTLAPLVGAAMLRRSAKNMNAQNIRTSSISFLALVFISSCSESQDDTQSIESENDKTKSLSDTSVVSQLKLGMSPEESNLILNQLNWSKFRDGTVSRAWGDIKTRFPSDIEDKARILGLSLPYGSQVWISEEVALVLHYCASTTNPKNEPTLFWIDYQLIQDAKESKIDGLPPIDATQHNETQ